MWGLLCSCWYQGALLWCLGWLWSCCAALGSSAQRLEKLQSKILIVCGQGDKPKIEEWLTCRAVQAFPPPSSLFCPSPGGVPFSLQSSTGSLNCGTVFLGPWFSALTPSHVAERLPSRAWCLLCMGVRCVSPAGAEPAGEERCCALGAPERRKGRLLVWELQCSTEGQKLASKINLGVGGRCLLL